MIKIDIPKIRSSRLLFIGIAIPLLFVLLWMIAKPYFGVRYNYSIGDISQEDIVSPRDITYVNIKETEKLKAGVRERVPAIFDLKVSIRDNALKRIETFFTSIEGTPSDTQSINEKMRELKEKNDIEIDRFTLKALLLNYKAKQYEEKISSIADSLLKRGVSDLERRELSTYEANGIILKRIKETEITHEKIGVDRVIGKDEVEKAIDQYIKEYYPGLDRNSVRLVKIMSLFFLKPDLFYNSEETLRFINEEMKKVEPVFNTIKKGAIIIERGEEITQENYPKLNAIILYTSQFNLKAVMGIGILLMLLLYISIIPFMSEDASFDLKNFLVISAFTVITVSYAFLITLINTRPHSLVFGVLIPIAGITMTAEILYKRNVSFTLAIVLPIFLLLISGNDPYTFMFTMGSGLIAIHTVRRAEKRSDLLKSCLFIVIVNELLLTAIGLLREMGSREFFTLLIWGAGNGVISVILCLGITPFFEILLNIPTNFRLLELSDLNTPIMKKMHIEAPGTYHHSINIANMAENAARYIKANALMVRVASLYHDIGKIPNAEYYIENNRGENKHEFIKPTLSNSILKAHVKIGVEMAKEMKLPEEIIGIVEQHHGTTLMKYFYNQALKNKERGSEVDKRDYQYQGPKPQTREAAIVMLADTVEAASRVLKNPSAKRIEELVNEITESKFREGQLNESSLTLRELMKISIAFRRYLTGLFHTRIEYPDDREIEKSIEQRNR